MGSIMELDIILKKLWLLCCNIEYTEKNNERVEICRYLKLRKKFICST